MAGKNDIPEMRPTLEEIRRTDESGKEYWSSRELCSALGYSAYWKFRKVIDKAIEVASARGMSIGDHFNQAVDMVKLGSGSYRKVETFHLSRTACLVTAENADGKKALVQQAREYFSQSVSPSELILSSQESNILLYKTAQGETRIEVIFNDETFWMSQKRMADLFGVDVRTVNYHLGKIYESGELAEKATIRKIGIVQSEGERLSLFLATMDYEGNTSPGTVTQEEARAKAYGEYEKYKPIQDRSYISDFDRFSKADNETPLPPFDLNPKES